jgi:hypothetical protein
LQVAGRSTLSRRRLTFQAGDSLLNISANLSRRRLTFQAGDSLLNISAKYTTNTSP